MLTCHNVQKREPSLQRKESKKKGRKKREWERDKEDKERRRNGNTDKGSREELKGPCVSIGWLPGNKVVVF